jgi:hypothetical protein
MRQHVHANAHAAIQRGAEVVRVRPSFYLDGNMVGIYEKIDRRVIVLVEVVLIHTTFQKVWIRMGASLS